MFHMYIYVCMYMPLLSLFLSLSNFLSLSQSLFPFPLSLCFSPSLSLAFCPKVSLSLSLYVSLSLYFSLPYPCRQTFLIHTHAYTSNLRVHENVYETLLNQGNKLICTFLLMLKVELEQSSRLFVSFTFRRVAHTILNIYLLTQ